MISLLETMFLPRKKYILCFLIAGVYNELSTKNYDVLIDIRGVQEMYAVNVSNYFIISLVEDEVVERRHFLTEMTKIGSSKKLKTLLPKCQGKL